MPETKTEKRIHIIDNTGKTTPAVFPTPKALLQEDDPVEMAVARKAKGALPVKAQKVLDKRRVRRAKKEAKDIGHAIYTRELSKETKKRVAELIAILWASGFAKTGERKVLRSLVDGLIAAGKEETC